VVTEHAPVEAKLLLEIVEADSTEKDVSPGRLLAVMVRRRTLARPVPEGFLVEPIVLGNLTQSRVLSAAGLFVKGEAVYESDGSKGAAEFLTYTRGGAPPGGRRLEPAEVYRWLVAALEAVTFTIADAETFGKDPRALTALRAGALEHLDAWLVKMGATAQAEYLLSVAQQETVAGFTVKVLPKGRPAFLEAVGRATREASVGELLAVVREIKAVAP
jgi:hypothetical protein